MKLNRTSTQTRITRIVLLDDCLRALHSFYIRNGSLKMIAMTKTRFIPYLPNRSKNQINSQSIR